MSLRYSNHSHHAGSQGSQFAPMAMPMGYAYHPASAHGICHSCCRPHSMCCCHRECRKEAKELLVRPTIRRGDFQSDAQARESVNKMAFAAPFMAEITRSPEEVAKAEKDFGFASASPLVGVAAAANAEVSLGVGTAFIGGCCCVHLSVEYTPSTPTAVSAVLVLVRDSDNTLMAWYKIVQPGTGYQIKKDIVVTKPGADLFVAVVNMTAVVRWCQCFSC